MKQRLPIEPPAASAFTPRLRDAALLASMLAAYVVLIWIGYDQFQSPGVMRQGQELWHDRAFLTTANAATLSGFQQTIGLDEFNPASQRGPLMAMALVIGGILFSSIAGGLGVSRILRLPYTAGQIALGAVTALALATLAGALLTVSKTQSMFDALFVAVAAYGNCGLGRAHLGSATDLQPHLLLLSAFAGSLSIPVLLQIFDRLVGRTRALSRHAVVAITSFATVYLVGTLLLLVLQWPGAQKPWSVWRETIGSSSALSLDTRTAGLHIDGLLVLPHATQWILILLMMIGANPGGTGGGIKGVTLVEIGRGVYACLRGRAVSPSFGIALVWVAVYLSLALAGLIVINCIEAELPGDRLLFLVISALSNVGLSHDPISMVGHSIYVLSGIMLAGRITPLAILWWMAWTTEGADLAIG